MLEELQEIFRKCLNDDEIVITAESELLRNLGINSFELFNLISSIEETFNISVPDRAISKFKTVQDILDFIKANKLRI
ncbi:hypothetical protein ADH76_06755 [Enterocloster clostridioformis]|nr:hypothetical protein A4V08_32965 [Lachnoclostridium sp. YL32]NDO28590.1 acyl carrier protein [Enterocloster clostridioformis]OXE71021.1 hypothetical protein ADH76_06755 [Enterocloster clostridioformis]QQR01173.1 acyl carrier protein [Enterocloster clostridioformis]